MNLSWLSLAAGWTFTIGLGCFLHPGLDVTLPWMTVQMLVCFPLLLGSVLFPVLLLDDKPWLAAHGILSGLAASWLSFGLWRNPLEAFLLGLLCGALILTLTLSLKKWVRKPDAAVVASH
ncbi:hypothetical protein COU78_02515 [Candidatus Peregrinibacteria bacterium CG10_big_fil_rev_8_21_14_0_10_49_24]|nr:MAG: hypothetical protein COV83_02495 [Candidatus Peregrinibacteria bacterium CG11_big_fil_rev_8_21_14_0_20_49_14]PIR51010.1 MAG: hypothetical protein COU78_02515 [Candidatus Peregrinibacteria bacterium CG10_big_fil_rev_8_21_14_0_10_49_24]PJA67563.1 MAG: hypothetical protein CO157_03995 [Candidatus Peregrinibacteria bacterium CG_4_9_14_3_um_filter_49_12]